MNRIPASCSRVSVPFGPDGRLVATPAEDGTAWVVRWPDGERHYLPIRGGCWRLDQDGALGQQIGGVAEERAPASPSRMRSYLLALA